jgi:phosphohistidine phosphatase
MNVTVIRHGTAEDHAVVDSDRALTVEGRDEVRGVATALVGQKPIPDLVLCSPYVRAVQTAELVVGVIGYGGVVQVSRALTPDAPPVDVRTLVDELVGHTHVLLVSHEPLLSATCRLLLGTPFPGLRRAEAVSMRLDGVMTGHHRRAILRFRIDPTDPRRPKRL